MKKNNRAKILINIVFIAIIIGVICKVFGGQSEEIIEQISKMTFATLFIIILCSAFFNAADGLAYYVMAKDIMIISNGIRELDVLIIVHFSG